MPWISKDVIDKAKKDPLNSMIKIPMILLQLTLGKIIYKYSSSKKDKKIIIFTNLYYTGNPRAVYERMLEKEDTKKEYDIYWMATNLFEFLKMKHMKLPVIYKQGVLSVKIYKNADLWVLAHKGHWNLPFILHNNYKKLKKIQLEHGVGPKATRGENREYHLYDAVCLSSKFIRKRHIKLWNAPPEKLYSTGFARLDLILKYLQIQRTTLLKTLKLPTNYSKIVLYAPTFDLGIWPWDDPYQGLKELTEFLYKQNVLLLIRPHPYTIYNKKKIKKIIKKYNNIRFVPMNKYPDTQMLLAITDILITDWSSIYTDFLVTKRPIIFLEVNSNYFLKEREKNAKPEVPPELRPGVRVKSKKELYPALEKVIKENYIPDIKFYEKCLFLIHGKPTGHYSDNVIEVIKKIIER